MLPLGFYRAQPWLAWHWGIEGGGWWVYYSDDLWGTSPDHQPSYGAVVPDYSLVGRQPPLGRPWCDGIEDFNAIALLNDWAEAKHDEQAKTVIREAVAYVAGRALTGTRARPPTTISDDVMLMRHRVRIREALERLQIAAAKPATRELSL